MSESRSADVERVVSLARTEARRLGHARIGTEHLLLGLLCDERSRASDLLADAGCTLTAVRHMVSEIGRPVGGADDSGHDFTPRAERALNRAGRFARQERSGDVTARHVLLGVLDVEGLACQVLRRLDVDLTRVRAAAEDTAAETAAAAPLESVRVQGTDDVHADRVTRPTCAGCGATLDHSLVTSVVMADQGDAAPIRVAHCGRCGVTIGVLG